MLFALRSLSYHYYSLKEYNEFKSNAAHYYEKIGELEKALKLYEKIDNFASIKRILVHNSMKNPAIGDFKLLKPYYEKLTKEEIMANPILACGMSMLYSLFLDVEKSEYYYDLIKNKLQNATSAEQIELTNIISYLDVALPQRGTNDIFSLLGSQKQMDYSKNSTIPFALTANTPSIINGGKDFTIYIKKYEPLIEKYSNLMNLSMGKDYSRGLISTIKAECMYELGEDQSALVRNIVKANMEVDNSLDDYHFVLARLSSMLSLERGDIENAIKSIDKFLYSLPKEKEKQYIDNISSLKALIYIYSDNQEEVNNWLSAQSIDIVNFYSLNKNNYLVRAYAYIYFEKYAEAYEIIQKLQIYARLYHRSYILAETLLLQAIIEFNVEKEYIDSLFEGLSICEERGLYRLPSRLGISLDKMIYEQRNKLIEMGISNKFLLTLNPLLLTYSTRYPLFLSKEENFIPNLSKTGVMILQLQSRGYSLNMIADRLCINLETIRYHSKQNYKKLGASGSAEAVAIAKKYGII